MNDKPTMTPYKLTKEMANKKHNWKGPECDHIHNFWLKSVPCTRSKIAFYFNKLLNGLETIQIFLTQGVINLIPKDGSRNDPAK